jgi:hypothetical protein
MSTTGSGATTYTANRASTYLTVGTAVGTAVRQSKARAIYQPGKSLLMFQTFIMAAGETNLRQRAGYFDTKNGVFFQLSGTTKSVALRSFVTGAAVDTVVAQTNWNIDRLDGSGESHVTLDITKPQILVADLEWLGVGRVRIGFVIAGKIVYCHQFFGSNDTSTSVYMTNPNLPIRWEIEATGTISGAKSLEAICGSLSSEGGYDVTGITASADTGTAANQITTGAFKEILAVRMQSGFTEFATAFVQRLSIINATSGAYRWRLVLNPTETVAGTWSSVTNSIMERNVTRTVTADTGTVISAGYVSSTSNDVDIVNRPVLTMGTTLAGVTDIISLQIYNISAQTEDYYGALIWREVI